MTGQKATASAGSNIAFIKYWGIANPALNLPLNDSISMTLDSLRTRTTVEFDPTLDRDTVVIDGRARRGDSLRRATRHLGRLRARVGAETRARVESENNFPMAAGIASSASAFAALTVAACAALGLQLNATEMSRIARLESGSASRSLFGGFVRWYAGINDSSSYAEQICDEHHWPALRDVVAVVAREKKKVSSADGHLLAGSSPFLRARLDQIEKLLPGVQDAIRARELMELGPLIEADALAMHFVMMSSRPPLFYWTPETVHLIKKCEEWREQGLQVYFTIDAGPNVHLICEDYQEAELVDALRRLDGVEAVLTSGPGGAPRLLDEHLF
jgi:diphosphomevalonate decarboxylase